MVNTDDFIKRLEHLMDYYSLNASAFADKIGVQRSSISHLLSGRNKPSLDFVMKILDIFPEVNLYWVLEGKQNFLKTDQKSEPRVLEKNTPLSTPIVNEKIFFDETLFDTKEKIVEDKIVAEIKNPTSYTQTSSNSEIFKIVIFYKDGTFKDFTNE